MKNFIFISSLFPFLLISSFIPIVNAYQPTWEDLSYFIEKQYQSLKRVTLNLDVEIFTGDDSQSMIQYHRTVYWTPQFKAVKTFDPSQKLIDFYYESDGVSIRSQKKPLPYDVAQILPPYLRLVHPQQIDQNFDTLQIQGREISLFSHQTDGGFFKIGNALNYVLIDPQTLLPAQLVYGVWQNHELRTINIKFSNLVQFSIRYPKQVDYLYNDFLFQRVTLKYISTKKKIPTQQIQSQARELLKMRHFPANIDYTK